MPLTTILSDPIDVPAADPVTRLIALLLDSGQCEARAVERARRVAEENGERLDIVMGKLGVISELALAAAYARLLGLPFAEKSRYPEAPLWQDRLSLDFLRQARAIPVSEDGDTAIIVLADPLDDFVAEALSAALGQPVAIEIGIPIDIEAAFNRLYPTEDAPQETEQSSGAVEDDAEKLRDLASDAPVIRLVNQIIWRAVETHASDIHIEPQEDKLRIRYRYDGELHEAESPPVALRAAITSRIKIMAHLDIAERRLPQDGRIRLAVRGQEVDFRVSTVPSLHGESVVLRVLDRGAVSFDFARLGLPAAIADAFRTALELPNGIVLVTGPTGSGKTTSLYTGLLGLNSVSRKIVTIEDPIEFQLGGINQIQVRPQIGLNFASLLRSILRQDPNVIMVGEIRDLETAQIAVQAALTGHLVLSTLHTNSAAASIARLRDMGLEDYLMTAVLRGVLAQRLVRRLCPHCKRETEAPPELVERFSLHTRPRAEPDRPIRLCHARGCDQCRGTGYSGRLAIAEFLVPDEEVERLIFKRADYSEIERAAVSAGMVTMFQSGLDAALAGVTTIEEVMRSIRAES
ncbi:Flp pilus assembly complex ATPase component TadA [Acidisoma cellulosilytica]|uniref:Flp pilus assembly complex ATPase component TadA n=1 Tax=Acidisoma cellulosilyticum TaxID=2802395 RepID=A0A963Z621_9PROT|nr:ATPase, T2SS/T4P/T4SS family [Acidisoma cellulosilyticum]MCB8883206.1 Flp pilus assembly complex ATPase component TadA [Acidisoma cellulosilyticum]